MNYYQSKGKAYLKQITDIELRIRVLRYRQEEILTEAEGLGVNLKEKVQTSPIPDAMATAVARLVDEQARLAEAIAEHRATKDKIIKTIEALEDARYKRVLFERYVEHKRLQEIADEMYYSLQHTQRLLRLALDEIGREIEKEEKNEYL